MSILNIINNNPKIKKFLHWTLIPIGQARPRTWVKWFVNPFIHKKGKGATIRRNSRIDVLPFNKFKLGENSTIEDFCTINNGVGDIIIGNGVRIGMSNVLIGPIQIGNNVIFAQNVVTSGLNHGYEDINIPINKQPTSTSKIIVEDDCWIGANVVITAGVTIGKHCVIAAGAIVTKNIPPFSVAVGNPAKVIKQYNFKTNVWVKI
jgi:acetyltransferase-like isoleucine patch superfamily enzyme